MSDIVYKNFAFSTPFLIGYEVLRIPIIDSDGAPAWPELFPIEKIEELRATVGDRYFSAQMMLNFVAPDRARLDPDSLHLYDNDFDFRTSKIGDALITGVTAYWDPSSGRKKADGSVCVLIYRDDKNKRFFIHDVKYLLVSDEEAHPLARQCEMVLDFLSKHLLHRICIETNGMGNALPEIMRTITQQRGIQVQIQKILNHTKKETRILETIEPILTTGRLYAHRRVQSTPLLSEMLGWSPVGATGHDDGLDAVAGAIATTPIPVRPLGQGIRPFTANTDFKL